MAPLHCRPDRTTIQKRVAVPVIRTTSLFKGLRQPLLGVFMAMASVSALAQAAPPAAASAASAPAGPTVRAEVGKPLREAQDLINARNGKDALPKIIEAEAVPNLTSFEAYAIARTKAIAAVGAGEPLLAITALDQTLASDHVPVADRVPLIDVMVRLSLQVKDYARAALWLVRYKDAGGADPALRQQLPQVLVETNDFAGVVRESQILLKADQAAGRASPESLLRNLAFSQNKLGDGAGYLATLELLATLHPKLDYWSELISRAERKPGFDSNRLRLDVYRLSRAVGVVLDASELADMAQLAQLAGLPAEAQALADEGFTSGLLGKGRDAALHQKLREQATKAAVQDRASWAEAEKSALAGKDGNGLVNLGFALSGAGQHDKALSLIEQGLAKGGLRRPDEVALHLALVQWRAGKLAEAARSFAAVKGSDGSTELARVWGLFLASGKKG